MIVKRMRIQLPIIFKGPCAVVNRTKNICEKTSRRGDTAVTTSLPPQIHGLPAWNFFRNAAKSVKPVQNSVPFGLVKSKYYPG